MKNIFSTLLFLNFSFFGICQDFAVTSLFETAADTIYLSKNSVIYKNSTIYSIGSFNGSITSNGTQLQTNYSRGIYLLKTTINNEFV
jgi:hypothetical protein